MKRSRKKSQYHLHAILCHSGSLNSGHYFCYIRQYDEGLLTTNPVDNSKWFKFSDTHVKRVFKHTAIVTGCGGYNTKYEFGYDDSESATESDVES